MGNRNMIVAITNTAGVVRVICLLRVKAAEAFTRNGSGGGGGCGERIKLLILVTTANTKRGKPRPTNGSNQTGSTEVCLEFPK